MVQKCASLNQMCTKNLSLLFAPSLFQTDGKGEDEVKIVEDLIDNYLYVFDSIKPEKEWALKSMKIYIGIRRKLKAPTSP
ncbi:arf-GAP with Rho-GAP domain, ANK repeat and PH domain-containing protein 3-like [Thunnus thynnus]|uniref:arf-GAP with Rho-GAP domain, ANK repeat and PH domain-containing protein 3-like n=1 Tax=Thunnus thynnus TaxID=8237 RepID=UPI0035277D8D